MKKIFSIFGALLAGAMMFSCSNLYDEAITFGTEITTNVESLAQFAAENAEAQTVEVTSNGEWIAVAPAWLEISPRSGGAGTTTVSVKALDNYEMVAGENGEITSELGPKRSATVVFAGEQDYEQVAVDADGDGEQDVDKDGKPVWDYLDAICEVAITQDGDPNKWDPAVPRPVTMKYFNEEATVGDGFTYILTGKITEVANTVYGNFYFEDETGTAYVYGLLTPDGKTQTQWAAAGLKVNDVITVYGVRGEYKGDPQMSNATYMSHTVGEASPIVDATIAEFLAAEKSGTQYRISGAVTNIAKAEYGNIYIKDATAEVYVYGVGAKGEFETMGVEVGDIVTLISNRGEYNGTPQAANSTLEKKEDVTAVASVTDFLALEESGAYYMVSGTVSGMAGAGEYGNIYLNDETSSIYVYGLLSGYKGEKKQFPALVEATGLKDGDTLTIIGKRTSYNDVPQVGSAFYFSHEAAQGGEEPEPEPSEPTVKTIAEVLATEGALAEGTMVEGVVISNMALNNLTSKKGMYIQDETAGLQFYLAANHEFAFGDKVQIDLSGVTVGAYNGAVQVSGIALEKITKVSSDNAVEAKVVTIADFLANKYEGQYIALEGVQVAEADLTKTWVMDGAHTSIAIEDEAGNSFVVFSSKYATYGAETVAQGSGTIKGISSINNGTMQIIFGQASDYAELTGARFGEQGGEEPEGGVLAWGSDDFAAIQAAAGAELNATTLAAVVATEDLTVNADGLTYKGLELILGGGKFKFGQNYGVASQEGDKPTRMQFGGTGNTAKQVAVFEVPAAGTLKIDAVSSSKDEARNLVVAIDGTEVGQYATVQQGQEATGDFITVDCSAATAGSKIYIYSAKSGINLFSIEYTY